MRAKFCLLGHLSLHRCAIECHLDEDGAHAFYLGTAKDPLAVISAH